MRSSAPIRHPWAGHRAPSTFPHARAAPLLKGVFSRPGVVIVLRFFVELIQQGKALLGVGRHEFLPLSSRSRRPVAASRAKDALVFGLVRVAAMSAMKARTSLLSLLACSSRQDGLRDSSRYAMSATLKRSDAGLRGVAIARQRPGGASADECTPPRSADTAGSLRVE